MKSNLIVLAVLAMFCGSTAVSAQECTTAPDSSSVSGEGKSFNANVSDGKVHLDFDVPFYSVIKGKRCSSIDTGNFGLGWISTNGGKDLNLNASRSIDTFFYFTDERHIGSRGLFTYGVGPEWKLFTRTDSYAMLKDADGNLVTGAFPEGAHPKFSRINVFSFSAPFLLSIEVSDGFGVSFGPVVNFNTSSRIVNKYTLNGEKQKDKIKNVHCEPVTVDVMFQVNLWSDINFFLKYSPMDLMDNSYWKDTRSLSFGFTL